MPDRDASASPFDRVSRPDPLHTRARDRRGKEALYSTAPGARRTAPIEVHCQRCDARVGLSAGDALRLLRPPWFANPLARCLWTRCPACSRRSWLGVTAGPSLRLLLQRPPSD